MLLDTGESAAKSQGLFVELASHGNDKINKSRNSQACNQGGFEGFD